MTPAAAPAPQSSPRLVHLDALRGLMLVMMAADHIPSDLQLVTDHIFGYLSAAVGFVLLAGLMAGMVYGKHRRRSGPAASTRRILGRVRTIYGTHLLTYGLIFLWTIAFALVAGQRSACTPPLMTSAPWAAVLMAPTLLYQPGLLDVLPMYCVFMLLLPVLLGALDRGHRKAVLALSAALWLASNLALPQQPFIFGWINLGAFNPAAWQLVFVAGVVFGHAWARGENLLPPPRASLLLLMLPLAAGLYAIRHAFLPNPWSWETLVWFTNKNNFAPLRLVDAALVCYFVYVALHRFPQLLRFRSLALLGRHSLQVFATHVVVAQILLTFYDQIAATPASRWLATGVLLGSMFAAAALRDFLQRRARATRPASDEKSTLASRKVPAIV